MELRRLLKNCKNAQYVMPNLVLNLIQYCFGISIKNYHKRDPESSSG